jgi:hypothetical protein
MERPVSNDNFIYVFVLSAHIPVKCNALFGITVRVQISDS